MKASEIAQRFGGELYHCQEDVEVTGFATDSREVKPGDAFLVIKGEQVDGYQYIPQAIEKGSSLVITEKETDAPSVLVSDLVDSIAKFGKSLRDEFSGPVIGITGSHGKTTTKEFIAAAFSPKGEVLKSLGNKNTEYTSPLTWFRKTGSTKSAIVEMGMRGFGQIDHLCQVHQPNIGVVTVVGTAHIEKVGSRQGVFEAKSELLKALPPNGTAIIWAEDDFIDDLKKISPCQVKTFGFSESADCKIVGYRPVGWTACQVIGEVEGESFAVQVPVTGRHQALNVGSAIMTGVVSGVSLDAICQALPKAELPAMRMEVIEKGGVTILLDTYNASPDSTMAALKTLIEGESSGKKVAVLGEMRELGVHEESGHRDVGRIMGNLPIDELILTGGATGYIQDEAIKTGFPESKLRQLGEVNIGLLNQIISSLSPGDVVLIKGSRALGLERALVGALDGD